MSIQYGKDKIELYSMHDRIKEQLQLVSDSTAMLYDHILGEYFKVSSDERRSNARMALAALGLSYDSSNDLDNIIVLDMRQLLELYAAKYYNTPLLDVSQKLFDDLSFLRGFVVRYTGAVSSESGKEEITTKVFYHVFVSCAFSESVCILELSGEFKAFLGFIQLAPKPVAPLSRARVVSDDKRVFFADGL